ncbi:MAG: hypothetical protein K8L99_19135 [Anaerolineae bacterium]|nr:hypothetical protein [Anaerolineae bacterium]
MAQEQFKVNVAQHRGGYTIDNEDGTKEFAFVTNRQHAHLFADTGNRMVKLEAAAEFLADSMPGIEAYAGSLTNEDYRSMWFNQIAKYKQVLEDLGLAIMRAPSNRLPG